MQRRKVLRLCGLGAIASSIPTNLLMSSAFAAEPRVPSVSAGNISDEQEVEFGAQLAAATEKDVALIDSEGVRSYLNGIMQPLVDASQRPNLRYSVKLINSSELNAFSLPGGFLYVYRGLVEALSTEGELAGTLAHEIGHVAARHSIDELARRIEVRNLLLHFSHSTGLIQRLIGKLGGVAGVLALLHYSRENETEADLLAFYEMLRAGWDPRQLLNLFAVLAKLPRSGSRYLSTHPPPEQRALVIRQELRVVEVPKGARSDSPTFHRFRDYLRTLPATASTR